MNVKCWSDRYLRMLMRPPAAGVLLGLALAGVSAGCADAAPLPEADPTFANESAAIRFTYAGSVLTDLPAALPGDSLARETERDWAIARGTVEWVRERGMQTLPVGEIAAVVGTTFVGTPYIPSTLELPGPEGLVVNLRGFDCVTLVEHLLVVGRLTAESAPGLLEDDERFRARYREELTRLRYRGGILDGYASRLHYFSEWIRDGEAKGILRDVTRELGGIPDARPIHFMSSHPEAYRQIAEDSGVLERIREMEARLNEAPRYFIPQDRIAEVEDGIRNGDVIAAVSTLDGLDVAHTGIAIRHGGRVHLLHAPLVGDSVEISTRPLAERIQGISGQQGIIVARPLDP